MQKVFVVGAVTHSYTGQLVFFLFYISMMSLTSYGGMSSADGGTQGSTGKNKTGNGTSVT